MVPRHLNIGVANARLTYLSYDHPIDTKVKVRNIGNRHRRLVKFDEECMLLTLTRPVDGLMRLFRYCLPMLWGQVFTFWLSTLTLKAATSDRGTLDAWMHRTATLYSIKKHSMILLIDHLREDTKMRVCTTRVELDISLIPRGSKALLAPHIVLQSGTGG